MGDLNIGIIGCGMIGEIHAKNFVSLLGSERVHIHDTSENALNAIGQKYAINNLWSSYADLINNACVQVIVICTPPDTHYNIILDCIEAKKNVLVEKPFVIDSLQLEHLSLIIQNTNLLIMDCSARHSRLQPKYHFVKEFIDSRILGEIYYVHHTAINRASRPGIEYHPNAKWFYDKERAGGGPIIDWGVYDLSFHLGILGYYDPLIENMTSALYSGLDKMSSDKIFTVEEHAICLLSFDKMNYYYERSSNAHNAPINETRIYGSRGGLKFDYLSSSSNLIEIFEYTVTGEYITRKVNVPMGGHNNFDMDHYAMAQHFLDCLQNHSSPILPIETSIKYMKILLEITKQNIQKFN